MTEQQARTLWRYMTNSNETRALLESMGHDSGIFDTCFWKPHAEEVARFLRGMAEQFDKIDDSEALDDE